MPVPAPGPGPGLAVPPGMAASLSLDGTAEAPPGLVLAQVQRAAFGVLLARVAAAGCAYVAQVLMARLMGGAEYGIFATVWVWIAILGHASTWGLGQAACRFVPAYRAVGDLDQARGFLAAGAAFALASGLATAGVAGALLALAGEAIGPERVVPFTVALLVLPLFALQDYAEGVARSFGWPLLAIAPPYLLRQGLVMAAMLGAMALGAPAEAWVAVACTLSATALSLAVQATLLLRRLARTLPPGGRRYPWRLWARSALPMALVDLTGSGFNFVDMLVLGTLMPPAAIGAYFAATRIQQLVVFIQFAASAATIQHLAAAQARGDRAGLLALVRRRTALATLSTLAIGSGIVAASPVLLALFGPGFAVGVPVLAVLVAGLAVQSALGPAEDLLTMLGGERACAAVSAGMLLVAALAIPPCVHAFGLIGAALAMAATGIARAVLLALVAHRRLGIATPLFLHGRP